MPDNTHLAVDIATIQSGLDAAVADTKDKLVQWIELNTARGRGGAMTIALVEIAIERPFRVHGALRLLWPSPACDAASPALWKPRSMGKGAQPPRSHRAYWNQRPRPTRSASVWISAAGGGCVKTR
jgi:hypothetical protein